MSKAEIKFGTDGWRALVAETFTFPNLRAVTQATASYFKSHPVSGRQRAVLIGYDTRPLGDTFTQTVAEVLAGNGLKVFLVKTAMPTPAISFAIRDLNLLGAVVVTASHNPFTYNGFKLKPFYAGPAESAMTRWIEKKLFERPVRQISLEEGIRKKQILPIDLKSRYLSFLRRYVKWDDLKSAGFKVGYDSMQGAGQDLLKEVCAGSRLKILSVRQAPWPMESQYRPEPIGEHLKELSRFVKSKRCDLGLATDGDADRVGVVGPDGRFVSSQETMALLVWHLLEDRRLKGMVVTTVAGTNLMERIAASYGVQFKRTAVGFKHIARLMRTDDVLFGGEESGGFGFKGCVPERDGLLAGLLVLEMMAMRRKSLSTLLKEMRSQFGRWAYSRADLALARPVSPEELLKWAKKVSVGDTVAPGCRIAQVQTMDGVKLIFEDQGWLLLRPSGTEPLLRIYSEAKSPSKLSALLKAGQRVGRQIVRSS